MHGPKPNISFYILIYNLHSIYKLAQEKKKIQKKSDCLPITTSQLYSISVGYK